MKSISMYDVKGLILKAVITILVVLTFACILRTVRNSFSVASAETKRELKCISVCIGSDDTLWSLASKYYSDEYNSIRNLVDEIKLINRMGSNQINAGNYIIIPYYE